MRLYPVATFASGPTNSMRGAALTSGLATCAVVDIGGTTADIGLLINGFPRETANEVKVAGVRTNFRMPDVLSLGIGGGSIVDTGTAEVGPGVGRLPADDRGPGLRRRNPHRHRHRCGGRSRRHR